MSLKILALITARSGSKRLPGKNIKILGGKPLVAWTIQTAIEADIFCDIIVSTDSHEIKKIAEIYGAKVPWLRPDSLSGDLVNSVDVALHDIERYEYLHGPIDIIVLLQPTSPFRTKELILNGLKLFKDSGGKSVVGVTNFESQRELVYLFSDHGGTSIGSIAEKDCKDSIFKVNGSLYITTPNILKQSMSFMPKGFVPITTNSKMESLDIDTVEDWLVASFYASNEPN